MRRLAGSCRSTQFNATILTLSVIFFGRAMLHGATRHTAAQSYSTQRSLILIMNRKTFLTSALAALAAPIVAAKTTIFATKTLSSSPVPVEPPLRFFSIWQQSDYSQAAGRSLVSVPLTGSTWVKPVQLHVGIGGTQQGALWPKDVQMIHYPIVQRTPDEALMAVMVNAAAIIALVEFPDDSDACIARVKELTDRIKIG